MEIDDKKLSDEFITKGVKFETAPEDNEEDEIDPETGKKKKKPADGEDESTTVPAEDEDESEEEESELTFSKALANRKKAFSRVAKIVNSTIQEASKGAYDALKKLQDQVNDPGRTPRIVDNGSTGILRSVFEPVIASTYSILQSIPLSGFGNNELNAEGARLLRDIRAELAEIANANSVSDKYAMIMSIRSLYLTLMATHNMIHGDANLVNSGDLDGQHDLWRTFQTYAAFDDSETYGPLAHHRNETGDNAIEPDLTMVKPMFLIFPHQDLKRELMKMSIDEKLIGRYNDDNDFGILGFFSTPTVVNGNGTGDLTPHEEDRTLEALFRMRDGENEITALNSPAFTWSENGTDKVRSLTPESYRKNNKAFLDEIQTLYSKAVSHHIKEMNIDICFSLVLTGWLNAAFKVLVETNLNGAIDEVKKGIKFDLDRFIGVNGDSLLFTVLSELKLGSSNVSNDDALFDSVFDMPVKFVKQSMAKVLGGKFHYSITAYKLLQADFKTTSFKLPSELEHFIGDNKIGEHSVKVTVIPKLYLPVDVTVNPTISIKVDIPRPRQVTIMPVVTNPFSFTIYSSKTHFVASRNASENDFIFNQSLLHAIAQMTNKTYTEYLDAFYDSNYYVTGNSGEERSLATIFGRPIKTSGVGYNRYFSALAPAYNKAKILGLSLPTNNARFKTSSNYIQYPLMDQDFSYNGAMNLRSSGFNVYKVFNLGDYIKAVFNMHADWSWVEAAIVASMIQTGYMVEPTAPQYDPDASTPITFGTNLFGRTSTIAGTPTGASTSVVSAVLRRARNFMDSDRYKFGFTRFDGNNFIEAFYPVTSKRITKADVIKAFRYSTYERTSAFLVDNSVKVDPSVRKFWPIVTSGQLSNLSYIIKEGSKINVTESAFLAEITKDHLDGQLVIYDTIHATGDKLSFSLAQIPATPLVGLKFTSAAMRNKVLSHSITPTLISSRVRFNEYCYIADDFYVSKIIYTLTVPTNTKHASHGAGIETELSVNNIKQFDIAINALHRVGVDAGNPQGFRLLLQTAFGINSTINTRALVRETDTVDTGVGSEGEGIDFGGKTNNNSTYVALTDASEIEAASFMSSFRYPQTVVVPAVGRLTGIPKHIVEASQLQDSNYWSIRTAHIFFEKLGATVENNRSDSQVQHLGYNAEKYTIFPLRQGLNDEYNAGEFDLAVVLPARTIIKTLEMEDKK